MTMTNTTTASTAATTTKSAPYGALTRTHADYGAATLSEVDDFYAGGYQLAANARRYLPALPGESTERYEHRIRTAGYINYLAEIVDKMVGDLFNGELNVAPVKATDGDAFYSDFSGDADRAGHSFAELLEGTVRDALLKRRGILAFDLPRRDPNAPAPATLADEDATGGRRAFAYSLAPECLINWKDDGRGGFAWLVIRTCESVQPSPVAPTLTREQFKIWQMANGRAAWLLFELTYDPEKSPPNERTEVPLVDGGVTALDRIPVMVLTPPRGLVMGDKLGPLAREHYQRRSELVSAIKRSLVAIPIVKLASELGAFGESLPAEVQQNPARGRDPVGQFAARGFMVVGSEDSVSFAEPEGKAYVIADRQLADLKDEMHRVVHMMAAAVSNTPSSLGRSGLSKKADVSATSVVLDALGRMARSFAERCYALVSATRGEPTKWKATGLDTFEVDDRGEVLNEAVKVDLIGIPSRTFKAEFKKRLAHKLLQDVEPDTLKKICDEIDASTRDEHDIMAGLERDPEALARAAHGSSDADGDEGGVAGA